jgi:hypothetical protein
MDESAAVRAPADMGGERIALCFVKRASREHRERDVGGVMLGRYEHFAQKGAKPGYRRLQARFNRAERDHLQLADVAGNKRIGFAPNGQHFRGRSGP